MDTSGDLSAFAPSTIKTPFEIRLMAPADAPISRLPQAGSTSSPVDGGT